MHCSRVLRSHVRRISWWNLCPAGKPQKGVERENAGYVDYELYDAIKHQGCTAKMVVYPRTAHILEEPKLVLNVLKGNVEWMDRYVRGIEPR